MKFLFLLSSRVESGTPWIRSGKRRSAVFCSCCVPRPEQLAMCKPKGLWLYSKYGPMAYSRAERCPVNLPPRLMPYARRGSLNNMYRVPWLFWYVHRLCMCIHVPGTRTYLCAVCRLRVESLFLPNVTQRKTTATVRSLILLHVT